MYIRLACIPYDLAAVSQDRYTRKLRKILGMINTLLTYMLNMEQTITCSQLPPR